MDTSYELSSTRRKCLLKTIIHTVVIELNQVIDNAQPK